ncbi:MAG: 5'-3' exonuclease [Bacteroidales bacterium]
MTQNKKLFLIDAFAIIYRAYYGLSKLSMRNNEGVDTSVVYGFANALLTVLRKQNPSHIAVCFDPKGKNFRHDMFPEYKANRPPTPDIIKQSVPLIYSFLEAMNIPQIVVEGFEADDVIGTLAKKAEREGFTVYMMTPDKDFGQLISENILMFKPARYDSDSEIVGVREICKRYGIENPLQVIDILSLWGDSSDNVPGAPGIGEVKACKLIAQYGSLEQVIANAHELTPKMKDAILDNLEQIERAKQLVTIDLNVPVEWNEEQLCRKDPNKDLLREVLGTLNFKSMARELLGEFTPSPTVDPIAQQGDLFAPF